jgi:hypothetical protein
MCMCVYVCVCVRIICLCLFLCVRTHMHYCSWDLHIGAQIVVFGKSITLYQCDYATRQWIEFNAKRLLKLKDTLEGKLRKYTTLKPVHIAKKPLSDTHLRTIMKDVASLKQRLGEFRPSLAANYKFK